MVSGLMMTGKAYKHIMTTSDQKCSGSYYRKEFMKELVYRSESDNYRDARSEWRLLYRDHNWIRDYIDNNETGPELKDYCNVISQTLEFANLSVIEYYNCIIEPRMDKKFGKANMNRDSNTCICNKEIYNCEHIINIKNGYVCVIGNSCIKQINTVHLNEKIAKESNIVGRYMKGFEKLCNSDSDNIQYLRKPPPIVIDRISRMCNISPKEKSLLKSMTVRCKTANKINISLYELRTLVSVVSRYINFTQPNKIDCSKIVQHLVLNNTNKKLKQGYKDRYVKAFTDTNGIYRIPIIKGNKVYFIVDKSGLRGKYKLKSNNIAINKEQGILTGFRWEQQLKSLDCEDCNRIFHTEIWKTRTTRCSECYCKYRGKRSYNPYEKPEGNYIHEDEFQELFNYVCSTCQETILYDPFTMEVISGMDQVCEQCCGNI